MKWYCPPHPSTKSKIKRTDLSKFEAMKLFLAQRKFNGTHVVIVIDNSTGAPDVKAEHIYDRRGKPIVQYQLTASMRECLLSLNYEKGYYVLDGELLHTKAKSKITNEQAASNTIVLFDLMFAGKYLSDVCTTVRLQMLDKLCGDPTELEEKERALLVRQSGESQLWLAEYWDHDFSFHFDEMYEFHAKTGADKYPEIEGIMLKRKDGTLPRGDKIEDVDWIVRCRKEKPNMYRF